VIKSISLLTRKAGMTHAQFVEHWVRVHAPLAQTVPGLRRYVQSHIVEERTRPDIPTTDVEIDGIAELWYDDREAMARAHASPQARALFADGALFIGWIKTYTVEEQVVVPSA
jgi:uncharacterized protein (TIGR02118 family)